MVSGESRRGDVWGLGLMAVTVVWWAVSAQADLPDAPPTEDFLRRQLGARYVNYAVNQYRPYRREIRLTNRFDYLGNFLAEGFLVYELDEQRPGVSRIRKDMLYRSLNNLIIAQDSYGPASWALTVGDEVRTQLTPLTFRQAGFNGLRWDVAFPSNKVTLLVTRGFDSSQFPTLSTFSSPVERGDRNLLDYLERSEETPVYNFAGHWESRLGDVLRFGATLVNQQQGSTASGSEGGFLRGNIPYREMQAPTRLLVRVGDDSPGSAEVGATVYHVFVEVTGTAGGVEATLSSDPRREDYATDLAVEVTGGRAGQGYREVRGAEAAEYVFTLPAGFTPRGARIRAAVANDYRIELAQEYPESMGSAEARRVPYQTLVRAHGEVRDFTNRREVVVEHGMYTGQTLFGCNLEATLVGLEVRAEVEQNLLYRQFPVQRGRLATEKPLAWYLTVLRDVGPLEAGLEAFRLDPRYGGGYDSRRGGVRLYTDKAGETGDEPMLAEYPLVDDNDDDDRYADDNLRDYPTGSETESGVYPGLDEDNDNIPDDDKNANGIPDYEEPFLLYYSDPQEFVYGVDINNNGVIDLRENDDKPDYPYDRDRAGWHAFVSLPQAAGVEGLGGALGYYRQRELAGPGEAISRYVRLAYDYDVPRWGRVELRHDSKRVEDDIPDPVYVFEAGEENSPDEPPPPDALSMRDSWVHTTFLGTAFTGARNLNVENNLQWSLNRQLTAGRRMQTVTMVNKAGYAWRRGRLLVQPMAKHLVKHVTNSRREEYVESWHQIAPILRVDVRLTEKTSIQFGQQGMGLPFAGTMVGPLAFRIIDRVDHTRELRATDSVLMLTVRGTYQGYDIVSNTGLQRRHVEYMDAAVASTRDAALSKFFITLVAGYDR